MAASLLQMVGAGLLSGVVSPVLLLAIQHKLIWKRQKMLEMKQQIFDGAIKALSLYVVDALDFELQAKKPHHLDSTRKVERRPETWQLIEETRSLVQAFFSQDAHDKIEKALKCDVSIENVPHTEFEERRVAAIRALSKELGMT